MMRDVGKLGASTTGEKGGRYSLTNGGNSKTMKRTSDRREINQGPFHSGTVLSFVIG